MPFLMEQFTGQQQRQTDLAASQLALQQAQKQVALQEQESEYARTHPLQEIPTQAGISPEGEVVSPIIKALQQQAIRQYNTGSLSEFQKTSKTIAEVQDKESATLKRNFELKKEMAGYKANAAKYALENNDVEGGLASYAKYDPVGAMQMYARFQNLPKDVNGKIIMSPEVKQALANTIAENTNIETASKIQHERTTEAEQFRHNKEIERQRELDRQERLRGQAEARAGKREEKEGRKAERADKFAFQIQGKYETASKKFEQTLPVFNAQQNYVLDETGKYKQEASFTPAGDRAFAEAYIAMTHPEYKGSKFDKSQLEKLGDLPARVAQSISNLAFGKELPREVRKDMFLTMRNQFKAQNDEQIKREDFALKEINRVGVRDPENFVRPMAVRPKGQPTQQKYSQEDLEFTAKQHGLTVEEVKKRLGVK